MQPEDDLGHLRDRVGRDEVVGADDPGEIGALGRAEERPQRGLDERDDIEDPHAVGGRHEQERQHERRAEQVGDDHDPLAVPTIDVGAGNETEQERRECDGDRRGCDRCRRSRESLGGEEQGEVGQGVSEVGYGLAGPQEAIVADLEQFPHVVLLELGCPMMRSPKGSVSSVSSSSNSWRSDWSRSTSSALRSGVKVSMWRAIVMLRFCSESLRLICPCSTARTRSACVIEKSESMMAMASNRKLDQ